MNSLYHPDTNLPSLRYLGCCTLDDPLYEQTRARILSDANPHIFKGSAAEGIGGPHVGLDMIWPMSIIMRALTSSDDGEILRCVSLAVEVEKASQ